MWQYRLARPKSLIFTPLMLLLLLSVACGGAATGTPPPTPTEQAAAEAPTNTPAAGDTATPTSAPASSQPTGDRLTQKSLHLAVTPLPQDSFIPWLVTSSGHLVFRPFMENLTTIEPQTGVSEVLPQLATEWEMSPDATEYTFKLRKGVQFHHDWGEFTVRDVINSLDKATGSDAITGCTSPVRDFMGADSATEMKEMGNLEVIDDHTFTMKLAQPQVDVASWWLNVLQATCAPIWSSAQFEAEGERMFETGPAGTGAFQFVRRTLKEFTEYERVPYDHWRVNPEFKTLRITTAPEDLTRLAMLLSGEADMVDVPKVLHDQAIDEGMVVLESDLPAVGLTIMPYGQYYVSQVNWNPDQEPWAAPGETGILVRKALNHAMDREELVNVLFKGRGDPMYTTIFHESLEGWNPRWAEEFPEKYGYDPERAKQLLDQAGYPGDASGQHRFSVEMGVSSLPGLPETIEVAQAYGQMLEDIGIDVTYTEAEFARFLDAFRDQHDAHFFLPTRVTIRPITANMRIYYYTGPTNPDLGRPTGGVAYMEDPLFDQVYEGLLVETDPEERNRLARSAGDKVFDEYRTIPLLWLKSTIVANPDVVEEYHFGGVTGVFTHLEYAKAVQ